MGKFLKKFQTGIKRHKIKLGLKKYQKINIKKRNRIEILFTLLSIEFRLQKSQMFVAITNK
jgi:hypothetical protein